MQLKTFDERYEYLKLNGRVSDLTFGFDRYINQVFYKSDEWLNIRDNIIVRDLGCDLGLEGYEIYKGIIIHHMNPINIDDIRCRTDYLLNPEYLISTSFNTHQAITFGDPNNLLYLSWERKRGDTTLW